MNSFSCFAKTDNPNLPRNSADDCIEVWMAIPPAYPSQQFIKNGLLLLSKDERTQFHQFYFKKDKILYLSAHVLLRTALLNSTELLSHEWHFKQNPYGKPAISNSGYEWLQFNLSYTHGLAACVVGKCDRLGIDVERYDKVKDPETISKHFFTQREQYYLQIDDQALRKKRFIKLWTLKESYIKCIGSGMSIALDSFSIEINNHNQIQL